jgi:acetylornithine deacetylase
MESALWQAAGIPAVVCGPAGGGLHAVDEWVDLAQLRRYPVAVAGAVGRFLAGGAA